MKTEVVRVRLTEIEKILFQEKANKLNMSMSDYIKYCCLMNPPTPTALEVRLMLEALYEQKARIKESPGEYGISPNEDPENSEAYLLNVDARVQLEKYLGKKWPLMPWER